MKALLRLLLVVFPLVGSGLAAPSKTDFGIEITISGPASPFASARLEAAMRRGAPVAGFFRRFRRPFGHHEGVGLVTPDALRGLMGRLVEHGLFETKPTIDPDHRLRYRIVAVSEQGQLLDVVVDDPWRTGRGDVVALIAATRHFVEAVAPPPAFVDPMLLPAESGTLRIKSMPPARVWLDGVPLSGQTPIRDARVVAGKHVARLATLDGAVSEDYEVSVEVGKLTTLNVTLSRGDR